MQKIIFGIILLMISTLLFADDKANDLYNYNQPKTIYTFNKNVQIVIIIREKTPTKAPYREKRCFCVLFTF